MELSTKTIGGEVVVLLRAHDEEVFYPQGHAIAQLIVQPYLKPDVVVVESLDSSVRGEKGFGSTNKEIAGVDQSNVKAYH